MIEKADWEAACRELIAEGYWNEDPPGEDEIQAYIRGALSGEDADRIEEALIRHPELLRPLVDPSREGAGNFAPLTQEEEDEDWAKIQAKLPALKQPRPRADTSPIEAPLLWPAAAQPLRPPRKPQPLLKISAWAAALSVIVLGGLSLWMWSEVRRLSSELGSPRVLEHHILLPDGVRGAKQPAIVLPTAPNSFLLAPSLLDQPDYSSYRLDILQATGEKLRRVWSASGLERRTDDTVEIFVPRAFLKSGPYKLQVYGHGADGDKLLATYTIQLPD